MITTPLDLLADDTRPAAVAVDGDRVLVSLDPATARSVAEALAQASDRFDPLVVDLIAAASNVPAGHPGVVHLPARRELRDWADAIEATS